MIKNPTDLNIPGELSDKQIELVIYMTMDYISTNFFFCERTTRTMMIAIREPSVKCPNCQDSLYIQRT